MAFVSKLGNMLKQTASRQIEYKLSASRPSIYQQRIFAIHDTYIPTKDFVEGLLSQTDATSLREALSKYGEVMDAKIIVCRDNGRSGGYGFVIYTSSDEAFSAIQALNGQDINGCQVRLNFTDERPRRGGGFGRGDSGDGGSYGGGEYGTGGASNHDGSEGSGSDSSGVYGGGSTGGNGGYPGGYAIDYGKWNDGSSTSDKSCAPEISDFGDSGGVSGGFCGGDGGGGDGGGGGD